MINLKNWLSNNYQLLGMLLGMLLYSIFGDIMTYGIVISLVIIIVVGKIKDNLELYNFDIVLLFGYITLFIIYLLSKVVWLNVIIISLGLIYIFSFFRNKRFN